jgi:hypothetical protein
MTASSKGVRWAYLGMGIGGAASILANVAHALLPEHPPAGSVIAAAWIWPVALFVIHRAPRLRPGPLVADGRCFGGAVPRGGCGDRRRSHAVYASGAAWGEAGRPGRDLVWQLGAACSVGRCS